jgi:glycosyltransferase involved in cell wall biosynthesis
LRSQAIKILGEFYLLLKSDMVFLGLWRMFTLTFLLSPKNNFFVNKKRKILLFSTLNPYPFWAGSETFWFDFVKDERAGARFDFHLVLADSHATRERAAMLAKSGVKTDYYKHFNVDFARRNLFKIYDGVRKKETRTLPWFDKIEEEKPDLVWFNVAALADLRELLYAARICKGLKIPYWLILQHGTDNFFLASEREIETVAEVSVSAKRFIFIAQKNRYSLERAIGQRLENAFHSVNALPAEKITEAKKIGFNSPVGTDEAARFFNLGRYSPVDKAQYLLLEALADDAWKNRNWQLSFIGIDGFGKFYLEKMIDFYGLSREKIKILPHTKEVLAEIARQDVLLMPSLAEGTPFAMIEAMACARPALGTPIGGIPELIMENQTGWLARTTDVADIAESLEKAWRERKRWREFGRNAQKHVEENFNEEMSFVELADILAADAT